MFDITPLIVAVIILLGLFFNIFLIPYVRSKTSLNKLMQFEEIVHTAVYSAEKLFDAAGMGDTKNKYVKKYLNDRGITYDMDIINATIEAEIKAMEILQGVKLNAGELTIR